MRVLLTGASGFLGSIIKSTLKDEEVKTIGRNQTDAIKANFIVNVPALPSSDLIIHCAGKAHSVPKTEQEKQEFFDVNVLGTQKLLNSIKADAMPSYFVLISTVAVYGLEFGEDINEDTPLWATDPYGMSKIEAERLVSEWCEHNHVRCTILRLPLIAGPNPPGNLGSMIDAINKGYYFDIDGGKAKKSIVLAKDVANVIISSSKVGGIYNLTDGFHPSFSELSAQIASQLAKKKPLNMPRFIARLMAFCGDYMGSKAPINSNKLKKITSNLTFDDSKARKNIGWNPTSILDGFNLK